MPGSELCGIGPLEPVGEFLGRRKTIIPGEQASTNRPITLSTEYWYSKQLGMNICVKRFDPSMGTQVFLVDQLNLGEPNPSLFEVPKGARILGETVQPPDEN